MPTDNPRLTVTLKPSTYAVLKRMSALTKTSQSAIVGDLVEQAQPILERMVRVIEAAQQAQEGVKDRVRENLEAAEKVLEKQLGLMLGDLEARGSDVVDGLEAISRRKSPVRSGHLPVQRGGGRAAAAPPASNRGGATPKRLKNKASGSRSKPRLGRPS